MDATSALEELSTHMSAVIDARFIHQVIDESVLPALSQYIRIENLSPAFDPDWAARGHMDRAVELAAGWVRARNIPGLTLEVVRLAGKTPLLFIEVPGQVADTVLAYGHLDKQPPMLPWADGLGPFTPVLRDGKLYGRGGADDGYAVFSTVLAVEALVKSGAPRARLVILVECCEESGSGDLPAYIEALAGRIGTPSLVVCLDSGCGNYDQLWCTTSLRGLVSGTLSVELLTEGIHSGDGSGLVASSFRVLRRLLSRLEDQDTGAILPPALHARIPPARVEQARATAQVLGRVEDKLPLWPGVRPVSGDQVELLLNRTWRPALSVTGAEGLPPIAEAGNVLRPRTAVKLSLRIPPGVEPERAEAALSALLTEDPPYGARVRFTADKSAAGWDAPELAPWLGASLDRASRESFGQPACFMGEGGTIPFMAMLGQRFPAAQFVITGVLGPQSNAHGPNEFLHVATMKHLTCCVARVLADHARR